MKNNKVHPHPPSRKRLSGIVAGSAVMSLGLGAFAPAAVAAPNFDFGGTGAVIADRIFVDQPFDIAFDVTRDARDTDFDREALTLTMARITPIILQARNAAYGAAGEYAEIHATLGETLAAVDAFINSPLVTVDTLNRLIGAIERIEPQIVRVRDLLAPYNVIPADVDAMLDQFLALLPMLQAAVAAGELYGMFTGQAGVPMDMVLTMLAPQYPEIGTYIEAARGGLADALAAYAALPAPSEIDRVVALFNTTADAADALNSALASGINTVAARDALVAALEAIGPDSGSILDALAYVGVPQDYLDTFSYLFNQASGILAELHIVAYTPTTTAFGHLIASESIPLTVMQVNGNDAFLGRLANGDTVSIFFDTVVGAWSVIAGVGNAVVIPENGVVAGVGTITFEAAGVPTLQVSRISLPYVVDIVDGVNTVSADAIAAALRNLALVQVTDELGIAHPDWPALTAAQENLITAQGELEAAQATYAIALGSVAFDQAALDAAQDAVTAAEVAVADATALLAGVGAHADEVLEQLAIIGANQAAIDAWHEEWDAPLAAAQEFFAEGSVMTFAELVPSLQALIENLPADALPAQAQTLMGLLPMLVDGGTFMYFINIPAYGNHTYATLPTTLVGGNYNGMLSMAEALLPGAGQLVGKSVRDAAGLVNDLVVTAVNDTLPTAIAIPAEVIEALTNVDLAAIAALDIDALPVEIQAVVGGFATDIAEAQATVADAAATVAELEAIVVAAQGALAISEAALVIAEAAVTDAQAAVAAAETALAHEQALVDMWFAGHDHILNALLTYRQGTLVNQWNLGQVSVHLTAFLSASAPGYNPRSWVTTPVLVEPGTWIDPDITVPEVTFAVPDVVGLEEAEAITALTDDFFGYAVEYDIVDFDQPAGVVIAQSIEAGTEAAAGTTVTITVSAHRELVAVPNVIGLTEAEATAALEYRQLVVHVIHEHNDDATLAGTVIAQSIEAGEDVAVHTEITITVAVYIFVPVIRITDAINTIAIEPANHALGQIVELSATVYPANASNQEIVWSIQNARNTGATLDGNTLTVLHQGLLTLRATIVDGLGTGRDFVSPAIQVNVTVAHDVVETVVLDVDTFRAGESLALSGTVFPATAHQVIRWELHPNPAQLARTGATLQGNVLRAEAPGVITVLAHVESGAVTAQGHRTTHRQPIQITVTAPWVKVGSIDLVSHPDMTHVAGTQVQLEGRVANANATYTDIVWRIHNTAQHVTAEIIDGNTLHATGAGWITVEARIENGQVTAGGAGRTAHREMFRIRVLPAEAEVTP